MDITDSENHTQNCNMALQDILLYGRKRRGEKRENVMEMLGALACPNNEEESGRGKEKIGKMH